jgi:hypothetical protein
LSVAGIGSGRQATTAVTFVSPPAGLSPSKAASRRDAMVDGSVDGKRPMAEA